MKNKQENIDILSSDLVDKSRVEWRVHTPLLLQEIVKNNNSSILRIPLSILGNLLSEVGERAAELNDPILNNLMLRLTIYSASDPTSPDYDPNCLK